MKRRTFLQATGAALACPAVVRAASATTLRFTPQQDLITLDPILTTAYITRNHAYAVYDTLYGTDASYRPTPQMVGGHRVEEDGRRWDLTLRDGLLWHDGERVLARDCVASIRRWAKRDIFGAKLMAATEELSAPDDRTIRFRLRRPFPRLPLALGKSSVPVCAMMPERLANTDPFKPVPEIVGSGPFRFKADERVLGAMNVYTRFERYVPRSDGPLAWTSGPKVVHYDRVEWRSIPDSSTMTAALLSGEQDWQEYAYHDQLPLLRRNRQVTTRVLDPTGFACMIRLNHLHPPFDDSRIRQAVLRAVNQDDFMQAAVGDDPAMYTVPLGFFCPGTPMASSAGLDILAKPDAEAARAAIRAAGYKGDKVVLMAGSQTATGMAFASVAEQLFRQVGLNVEVYAVEFNAMLQRRNRRDRPEEGGWSAFVTTWSGTEWLNPAVHGALRADGSYPGWSKDDRLEALRNAWFEAPDEAAEANVCRDMQLEALRTVPYLPLGQYLQPTAYRNTITGVLDGFPTFWNVRPA